MNKIRMLIADVDAAHIANVRKALSRCPQIIIEGTAATGSEALKRLSLLRPDVLLTDIQLPEVDGIALIRESRRLCRPPVCIACTRFYSETCMEAACKSGAAYFLYKPIDYGRLPGIILECYASRHSRAHDAALRDERQARQNRIVALTRRLMLEWGIPSRLSGSLYILDAALRLREDGLLMRNLTHGLYAEIAARHSTSAACVERALRSAIGIGYERGALNRIFNYRPTNKEFLECLWRRLNEELAAQPASPIECEMLLDAYRMP